MTIFTKHVAEAADTVTYNIAPGVQIDHEHDSYGNHRLVGYRQGQRQEGAWAAHTSLAHLDALPGECHETNTNPHTYIGATEYGLLDNAGSTVARVQTLSKNGPGGIYAPDEQTA